MAEETKTTDAGGGDKGVTKIGGAQPVLQPKAPAAEPAQDTAPAEPEITAPLQMNSLNGAIAITKDGDDIEIVLQPTIVEEVGAYRRCPVKVKFKEGHGPMVIPMDPLLNPDGM